jgi:hypothetical protein
VALGRDIPTVEETVSAVSRFEKIPFETPDGEESDGFLFEYGKINWLDSPTFVIGLARQLEHPGEDSAYSQVKFEYRYRPDAELDALEPRSEWWFRGDSLPFAEWLGSVKRDPVWDLVSTKSSTAFEVWMDPIC